MSVLTPDDPDIPEFNNFDVNTFDKYMYYKYNYIMNILFINNVSLSE